MNLIAETHKPNDSGAGGRRGVDSGSSPEVVEMPHFAANLKVTSPVIRYKRIKFTLLTSNG